MTRIYSNKGRSAAIRAELKKLGYNSKQISVKSGFCGCSDYSQLTIKDLKVRIKEVKKIVRTFESVDYDHYSQEILAGGNTYIRVQYDYAALESAIEKKVSEIEDLVKGIDKGERKKIERDNFDFFLCSDENGIYKMIRYEKGAGCGTTAMQAWDFESLKYGVARAFVTDFEDYE